MTEMLELMVIVVAILAAGLAVEAEMAVAVEAVVLVGVAFVL